MAADNDGAFEPDQLPGVPHPRQQFTLFGHRDAEQAFLDGWHAGRLHHAWLIGGPEGIGKATLAYRVARFLLASRTAATGRTEAMRDADSLAVGADHPVARQVAALSHPNLAVLRRAPATDKKAASATIPVEAVRRAVSLFGSTAADGGYRVCVVDSAEDLTVSSANALLKLVEEPPVRSAFLIVSHAPHRVLPTIRSRCRRLQLQPLAEGDLRAVIGSLGSPWADIDSPMLERAIAGADGSVRRVIEMLDEQNQALVAEVKAMLEALPRVDEKRVLALAESMARRDADAAYTLMLDTLSGWVSRQLNEKASLGAARLAPLVEVCEKVARAAREADTYNLDRRPLVLGTFGDLAEAVRRLREPEQSFA
jgi:DNA polymerase III subunit delta'